MRTAFTFTYCIIEFIKNIFSCPLSPPKRAINGTLVDFSGDFAYTVVDQRWRIDESSFYWYENAEISF